MPAWRRRWRARGWACRRCCSPAIPRRSARCRAIRRSVEAPKANWLREIDALGGAMGRIADQCSLHARFLNESKGPSVRALRQQMDKPSYAALAIAVLRAEPNLRIVQAMVEDLIVVDDAVARRGVRRWCDLVCAASRVGRPGRFWAASRFAAMSCRQRDVSARRRRSDYRTRCVGSGFRPAIENRNAGAEARAIASITARCSNNFPATNRCCFSYDTSLSVRRAAKYMPYTADQRAHARARAR